MTTYIERVFIDDTDKLMEALFREPVDEREQQARECEEIADKFGDVSADDAFAAECAYDEPCKQCIHPVCKNYRQTLDTDSLPPSQQAALAYGDAVDLDEWQKDWQNTYNDLRGGL